MLTPENAGCPKCFAPLSEQRMRTVHHLAGGLEIQNGNAVMEDDPTDMGVEWDFVCLECGHEYDELRQLNFHDMAAYAAAQEKKKDIAACKAQSKKKKKGP